MTRNNSELDRLREGRTELENHYIDELVGGSLSRRDFLRRGSTIGMSVPLLGRSWPPAAEPHTSSASSSAGHARGGYPQEGRDAAGGDPGAGRGGQPADRLRRRRAWRCSTRPASS